MNISRRIVVLAVIAGVIAAGFAIDTFDRPAPEGDTAVAVRTQMPSAAPTRALSSTWFCAGGTGAAGGNFDHVIVIANPATEAATATVTVSGTEGEPATIEVPVPALDRAAVRLGDVVAANYVAATVDIDGGAVAVEHEVNGPLGYSSAPCASSGSERWFFADGSTAREDTMLLALYNPFPEDAIADLSFSTDQGRAVPADFQGIVVKGGRLAVINIGDHVRRRDRVAATVETRRGRLVADRLQLRNGAAKGISVALGAPSVGDEWWFPDGYAAEGIVERFSIYNPGAAEALVTVELTLAEGSAEPFDLTVPPRGRIDLNANEEERIPKDVGHSAVIRSLDAGVVAERSVIAGPPSARLGTSEALGGRRATSRWLFPHGDSSESWDEWITVVNPTASPVQISFTSLAGGQPLAIEGLQDVEVAAGRRAAFRMSDHVKRSGLPLLLETTGGRVVAERALYRVGGVGIAFAAGIPLDE